MKKYDSNTVNFFFRLLRAGLWGSVEEIDWTGTDAGGNRPDAGNIDWRCLYRLAMEQTVAGYTAVGLERFASAKGATAGDTAAITAVPEKVMLAFNKVKISTGLRNFRMNDFIVKLFHMLNDAGIEPLLLKGQGVARNYLHPELRQPGDIDLLLHGEDYEKAKMLLVPKADKLEEEGQENLHLGIHFGDIEVELHGTINAGFGKKNNVFLSGMQSEMFGQKDFSSWVYEGTDIKLPSANFDAVFIFTHFLHHFYYGGLGLRQICDWTMHLHKNSRLIDVERLEPDIKALGLLREWQTFGCFAVKYLGLTASDMPMYSGRYYESCDKIMDFLFAAGNFGHHRGRADYSNKPYLVRKAKSLFLKGGDMLELFSLFPGNTIKFFFVFLGTGFSTVAKGK